MLKYIKVYQQPSGFVDTIIMKWIIEAQTDDVVMSLHQRDMFAAAMSEDVKRACYMAHECQVFVGPKMTAVLQLADTDQAFPLKAAARFEA